MPEFIVQAKVTYQRPGKPDSRMVVRQAVDAETREKATAQFVETQMKEGAVRFSRIEVRDSGPRPGPPSRNMRSSADTSVKPFTASR